MSKRRGRLQNDELDGGSKQQRVAPSFAKDGNEVKIWFQNRRSKYKKMMKAAQAPGVGGGLPLGAPNQGGHSPSQHQNMHQAPGGGSSSGSPSHFLPPGHSPTPSSTPVSELSPGLSPPSQAPWEQKPPPHWVDHKPPQMAPQTNHAPPQPTHAPQMGGYVPQYWYQPETNPSLLTLQLVTSEKGSSATQAYQVYNYNGIAWSVLLHCCCHSSSSSSNVPCIKASGLVLLLLEVTMVDDNSSPSAGFLAFSSSYSAAAAVACQFGTDVFSG
ncbi:conserved hypothetical protein [Culex quinquefasciatus]|uniref:Homeobox domain-containing protein n=1 Tax=Culex quinquefasciatus TaxID=7176 RepID=B0WCN7_CULQU|nr:conserved hypothetical protein [Culex quinquefasciatus]|eukprot:XP_001846471.1 conserved hypothetical protein [Culex quinquefasciatus]